MRVLSVQHYPEFGGPHNEILKLEPHLNARGVQTVVLLTDQPGSAAEQLAGHVDLQVAPLERFRWSPDPRTNAKALIHFRRDVERIRSTIRLKNISVVKVHGPHNPHGAIAARLEGVPVVWVLSSTRPSPATRRVGMVYVRRMADALLVNGRSLARFYPGCDALADRTSYYYPPIDCTRFSPPSMEERQASRLALNIPPDAEVVGTVANITPQKGIEFFVIAASLLIQQRPDVRFVVAGGVNPAQQRYFDDVRRLAASLGLSPERLQFLGARTDVPRILAALDVKVISSRAEGTTATAGEALACGIPVVATNVGAVGDVVDHDVTGLLVPSQDPRAIADATLRLLDDAETRRSMGAAGRERVRDTLGIDACVEAHLAAYRFATAHHARGGDRRLRRREAM